MDEIREDKLIYYRRVENIIKNVEEDEAKTNEAIRRKLESNRTSIGPANDLLRFFYILEQQYQSDSPEIRTTARENVLEYIGQFRQSDDDDVVEEEEEEEDNNNDPQSAPIVPLNQHPPTVIPQSRTVVPSLSQPPTVVPFPPQPLSVVPFPPQPLSVVPSPQPTPVVKSQPSSIALVTDPDYIKQQTLDRYQKLLFEAEQYEKRYKTIDLPRKKQLASPIKDIMNKLRKDTFTTLTNELFDFLNGQTQKVSNQNIRISNEEERLLCLSILATLILAQLLGGDLNYVKTENFLPLVGIVSENQQHKEFSIIFLERLHKKCPYTVPFYPKRQPTMTDKQYFEAMGYTEKQEGYQRRLETETEFLNRMSGLIRLFCKLLVRRGPPFDNNLSYAWTWFSDVLNLPPRPNITAVLLRVFLDEAGEIMLKQYQQQFPKIIQTIRIQYLPKLERETGDDQIARLKLTLDTLRNKF